jgi:L-aminopeptidase/D-esterase-like protein
MRFLEEHGIGFETGVAKVPIVPTAVLYDLAVGDHPEIRPGAESGHLAALAASRSPVAEGNVGAGAGATLGKLAGMERAMKSGLGSAALRLPGGATVAALFAVNAYGDVVDPATGQVVAGVRTEQGNALADARRLLRGQDDASPTSTPSPFNLQATENTTLGVVATDVHLNQVEASRLARLAHAGLARVIYPCHTPWDGDTIFTLATGAYHEKVDFMTLGALAAEVSSLAIIRAVWQAQSLPGLPAAVDLVSPG